MKKLDTKALFALFSGILLLSACNDDPENELSYNVPNTYNFQNVNYSGQTTRLHMMEAMTAYMKTGNEGAVLDAQQLKNMYANTNNAFEDESLNSADKDLRSKTFELDQSRFDSYMNALAQASQSAGQTGSNGKAGIVTSGDGSKYYLMDANGDNLKNITNNPANDTDPTWLPQ